MILFTARRYAGAVCAVVMCPSVHLSVTRRYCIKTAKYRITQTTPYDSLGTVVFDAKNLGEIPTESPNGIAK